MMMPPERTEEQRDELVDRPLGSNAMLFFDPTLHGLFGGEVSSATELLADDIGIEQLIERLEEWDEDDSLDA